MIKVIKKYTEVSMILFSIALLQISNLFQWDNNPIMGLDKVCADILIIRTAAVQVVVNAVETCIFKHPCLFFR